MFVLMCPIVQALYAGAPFALVAGLDRSGDAW
jgi:hypothetical protein